MVFRFLKRRQDPQEREEKIESGLEKSRRGIFSQVAALFDREEITDSTWEELEELLIAADVGVETTLMLLDVLQDRVEAERIRRPSELRKALKEELQAILDSAPNQPVEVNDGELLVMLIVGVNGVGKTTTVAKLAHKFASEGAKVVVGAADTFRAAAIDQLQIWGERAGVPVIAGAPNSDPAAVVHDALAAARSRSADVLIVDTAGRLHTKYNLMEELKKIQRVIDRNGSPAQENLLVLDATTGQNGLVQARKFAQAVHLDGVVLAKMDGTAKGGIAFAIVNEMKIPIRYLTTGEKLGDIAEFDSKDFVNALLG
ncbi:signal recognition particle-docking protein FtsY [Thermobaculum terrenum ATCC BAA-798]|uniref:Signal recognition particle receptor FtsY n=1 Tax=Thermobaculum terrenum (strain ATCC BAA-798 / CCMEE 7001 / YNP1) TaxID=525904 RepID=D1CFI7_THET1|nr:signal recognition particle-docking protein FtsY [Thermobaculum terrenum]ACZ41693.1 signal recognition particle-docking protein FtsY [Thermobaculum terrenum ATCC BAA-798]